MDFKDFGKALLSALAPTKLAASAKSRQARQELREFGVTSKEIDSILLPAGEPSLAQQLKQLATSIERRKLLTQLTDAAGNRSFTVDEQAAIKKLHRKLERSTLSEREVQEKSAMLGFSRVALGVDLHRSIEDDLGISRLGVVGERCVQLYRLLDSKVPAIRRQGRGTRRAKYNQRALQYTAVLVSGTYGWYGMKPLKAADIAGHVQRKPQ